MIYSLKKKYSLKLRQIQSNSSGQSKRALQNSQACSWSCIFGVWTQMIGYLSWQRNDGCLQHFAVNAVGLEKNHTWRQKQVNDICVLNLSIREKYGLLAKHSSKSKMDVDRACSEVLKSTQQSSGRYMFCEVLLTKWTGDPCWCTSTAAERAVRCCWQR